MRPQQNSLNVNLFIHVLLKAQELVLKAYVHQGRDGILRAFAEGGKPENPEKHSRNKDENQQKPQPTCETRPGNRTWTTAIEGECPHLCAFPRNPCPPSHYIQCHLLFSEGCTLSIPTYMFFFFSRVRSFTLNYKKLPRKFCFTLDLQDVLKPVHFM